MKRTDVAALVGLALVVAAAFAWYEPAAQVDSDRHYHRAISRLASGFGYLKTLPQVEDLGWGQRFPDKEYLFHLFSTWGLRLGGETGFRLSALLWTALALAALYALCRLALATPYAFAVAAAAGMASGYWAHRLILVRPLVLAIAAALWLCVGLLTQRRWLAALAAGVFILGYHAFYIVLLIVLVFLAANRFDRAARRTTLAALAGLVLGVVINPYFPSTAAMMAGQIAVALTGAANKGIGVEVPPLTTAEFLRIFTAPLGAIFFCVARPWVKPFADPATRTRLVFAVGIALVFWGLALWTPRAGEYAVPLSAVALAHAISDLSRRAQLASVALVLALQVPSHLKDHQPTASDRYELAIAPAIEHLPAAASGKKVLNCAFDEGSTLIDLRPDVRFVEAMDPTALQILAPALANGREELREGRAADPWSIVHGQFKASYVLCGYPAAIDAMDADPRFERIYPPRGVKPAGPHHDLFAVRDDSIPAVRRFEVLGEQRPLGELQLLPDQIYLDLERSPMSHRAGGCLRLRPLLDDTAKTAEVAVLGGGPRISLKVDGKPWFATDAPLVNARWNSVVVPLPKEHSDLMLEVCPDQGESFWGLSLSLWTWDEVQRRCGAPRPSTGVERRTCLGPVAQTPDAQ